MTHDPPGSSPSGPAQLLGIADTWSVVTIGGLAGSRHGLAFVRSVSDPTSDRAIRQVWMARHGGVEQLTEGPDDQAPAWLGPDRLAFLRPVDGHLQVHVVRIGRTDVTLPVRFPGGVLTSTPSPDASRLAVVAWHPREGSTPSADVPLIARDAVRKADGVGWLTNRAARLHVVDLTTRKIVPLTANDRHVQQVCWSPDGTTLAYAASTHPRRGLDRHSDVFLIAATGRHLARFDPPEDTSMYPVRWIDEDRILVAYTPYRPTGHTRLAILRPRSGAVEPLFADLDRNVSLGSPAYPGMTPAVEDGHVVFAIRDRGATHLWRGPLDGSTGPVRLTDDDDLVISDAVVVPEGIALVSTSSDASFRLELWSTDPADSPRLLLDPNADLLASRRAAPKESVAFAAADGTRIQGWLRGRRLGRAQPLLVDLHGGPHNAWTPALDLAHLYQEELADRGWLVLTPNPRGSDGYGEGFFRGLVERGWGRGDEGDVLAAIDDLVSGGVADPERIAVSGYSYGGYLAAWLTARFPDLFAAAVVGGVVANRVSHAGASDYGPGAVLAETGQSLATSLDHLWNTSPLAVLDRPRTPTLLLHGENDTRCPLGQAEELYCSLLDLGVSTELVVYPGASHLFVLNGRPTHRVDWQRRLVDWVIRHSEEASEPPSDGTTRRAHAVNPTRPSRMSP